MSLQLEGFKGQLSLVGHAQSSVPGELTSYKKCKLSKLIEPKVRFKKMNPGIRNSLEYRFRANEMIEPIDLSLKLNSLTISISKTVLLFHRFYTKNDNFDKNF